MKSIRRLLTLLLVVSCAMCAAAADKSSQTRLAVATKVALAQTPTWSEQDMNFFLHGSMSTEVVPETVLRAFILTYPDLFPTQDLSHLGLIPDPAFGWPVGFSRSKVAHLGGMSSVGVNCAACHVAEIAPSGGGAPVRVLGATSHFNAEAFFGAVTVAGFRTADPANMKRFLSFYLAASDAVGGNIGQERLAELWKRQEPKIIAAISADPTGSNGIAQGALHEINGADLWLNHQLLAGDVDLAALSGNMLKLFHNMRASLHIPDQPPDKLPSASGPGRNDAFGLLSAELFGAPQPYAPVKYGLVWNLSNRPWVHWDGNTRSPIGRNLLASLGLGAPLVSKRGWLDLELVKRHTELSQAIRPPRYPFAINQSAAGRGAALYKARCAHCHEGPENDTRLHSAGEIGTDPRRAESFTQLQADRFDKFLAELETPGYTAPMEPGLRSTQKYWAPSIAGVWARSPYLHNGSVRTMQELLTAPAERAKSFHRGSRAYDSEQMGYTDEGVYVLDASEPGNSNAGHNYGTDLSKDQKRQLIEYLKTR